MRIDSGQPADGQAARKGHLRRNLQAAQEQLDTINRAIDQRRGPATLENGGLTLDLAKAKVFHLLLTESVSLRLENVPEATDDVPLIPATLLIRQDQVGGHRISFPPEVLWSDGRADLSLAPGARAYVMLLWDGEAWLGFRCAREFTPATT